jgi:hypothetical protein
MDLIVKMSITKSEATILLLLLLLLCIHTIIILLTIIITAADFVTDILIIKFACKQIVSKSSYPRKDEENEVDGACSANGGEEERV